MTSVYAAIRTVRTQLSLILLALLLIAVVSLLFTYASTEDHDSDHTMLHLLGRQRELMLQLSTLPTSRPQDPAIAELSDEFEQNLVTLLEGATIFDASGEAQTLRPVDDAEIRTAITLLANNWDTLQSNLAVLAASSPSDQGYAERLAAVDPTAQLLYLQLNALSEDVEVHTQSDINGLRLLQAASLVTALVLLGWGYLIVRREIIRPSSIMAVARNGRDYALPEGNGQARSRSSRFREMFRPEFENARELLENIVDQRTRELITAFEFSQEIVRQPDPGRLMNLVTEKAQTLLAADSSAVCLIEPEGATLQLMAVRGEVAARIELPESSYDQEPIQVVSQGPPAYSSEACANCAFFKAVDSPNTISVPFVSGEQKLGTLCMARGAERPFSGDDRRALSLLANSAAIAISNTRLAEENQRRVREAAVRDERDRLTAELHDNLAQTLAHLNLTTNRVRDMLDGSNEEAALGELENLRSGVDTAYTQVRSALGDLRQPPPSSVAFGQELAALVEVFRETSGVATKLISKKSASFELSEVVQQQGLYIVREALANVRRHAAASSVVIRVKDVGKEVRITIEDDGRGFDPTGVSQDTHLGLAIMHARAERCGGVLTVYSAPGGGTRIGARLPKKQPEQPIRLEAAA